MVEPSQLSLVTPEYCYTCPADYTCDEKGTERGCSVWGPPHPNLLHPTNPDWLLRFTDINGVDIHSIKAIDQAIPALPRYIPRTRLNTGAQYQGLPAVAISLCQVERLVKKARQRQIPARVLLGLPDDCLLAVLGFENDSFLESVWPRPRRQQLVAAIHDLRPDLAVAWGYSVWYRHVRGWSYPRIEQLYNMKRSLLTYQHMQRWGIPAVPHVYWGNSADLDRWARWLAENPSVSTIAIDIQTADRSEDWEIVLRAVAHLREVISKPIHALFNGPCTLTRVRQIIQRWPECSISNFAAYFSYFVPHRRRFDLRAPWVDVPPFSRAAIFKAAADEYAGFMAAPEQPTYSELRWTTGWSMAYGIHNAPATIDAPPTTLYPQQASAQLALPWPAAGKAPEARGAA